MGNEISCVPVFFPVFFLEAGIATTAKWVDDAIQSLALSERVSRVNDPERAQLIGRVASAFLVRPGVLFWWEHLKVPSGVWQTEHGYMHLARLALDPQKPCWLITGLTDADENKGVFLCTPELASALIGECPAFEYALVDPDLRWMVIENHHDVLVAVGEAIERLIRLRG